MGLGINVSIMDYADDTDALAADPATAQAMLNEIAYFSHLLGMKINTAKTKVMDLNKQSDYQLVLYGQGLERQKKVDHLMTMEKKISGFGIRGLREVKAYKYYQKELEYTETRQYDKTVRFYLGYAKEYNG
ncbi:hypothetical protein QYM36_008015 [Artemia franciscana]|uniref:Reverse transcriptase domain-containing protein n=1 Tax=Artemia franciscana TaxID=6661 RepID=A0AA88LM33_ARTSF|nr:hypothetical protein QYM36_008015 [Artemia franciscana]